MKNQDPSPAPIETIDDPEAPVIFAPFLHHAQLMNGNWHLTFTRLQHEFVGGKPKIYAKVCLRVVIPESGLDNAGKYLQSLLEKQTAHDALNERNKLN